MYWSNWDHIEKGEARARQGAMLHRFLKEQVLNFSPYYIDIFKKAGLTADDIRSVDDLRKIPFTNKNNIAPTKENPKNPRNIVLQPDPETYKSKIGTSKKLGLLYERLKTGRPVKDSVLDEYLPVFFIATTGRTSNPTPFVYSMRDMAMFKESARRLYQISGMDRRCDFMYSAFPYAPHLAFWIVYEAAMMDGMPAFHSGGGKILGTERIITMVQALGTTVLVGIPGYIYHLLTTAKAKGADYSKIRLIILGGERVTPGYKKRVYELLTSMGAKNPKILSTFGFTEARTAWLECPVENSIEDSTGYHLYPDMQIFEIVDPDTREPVKDGEPGEIVYTCLDWRGSVVLRYMTGDYCKGGIVWSKCPGCGRIVPRLSSNITRLSDKSELQFSKVRGTLIDLNEFFPIMHDIPEILEWQVEITKAGDDPYGLDEINLCLALKEDIDHERAIGQLQSAIMSCMELQIGKITIHTLKEMTQMLGIEDRPKEQRIVDKRKELESRGESVETR